MKYIAIKPFHDITGYKAAGDPVELSDARAAKLRRMGLIGGRYEVPIQVVAPIDTNKIADAKKKAKAAKKVK